MSIPRDRTALLVIDMQNDFVEESGQFPVPAARDGAPSLARFINDMRERGLPVWYTRHTYDPSDNVIEAALFPNLSEGGLREGTHGWEIFSLLAPHEEDRVVNKPRYDAFHRTTLDEELRAQGITHLLITGTMTEVCCESTARSGMVHDYHVVMVEDLLFTRDAKKHESSLQTCASHFGHVRSSSNLRTHLLS